MSTESPPDPNPRPLLRLYIAGETPSAMRALESRTRLIEALGGKVNIEIVDILERPEMAETAGILATPTLSDDSIDPPRRIVGDIGNIAQVLQYFGFLKRDMMP